MQGISDFRLENVTLMLFMLTSGDNSFVISTIGYGASLAPIRKINTKMH